MKKITKVAKGKIKIIIAVIIAIVIFIVGIFVISKTVNEPEPKAEIITESALQNIINVNELSTIDTVYNGVVQIMNEKKPEKTDYYVAYEAKVKAGLDFTKIVISIDENTKTIHIDIPEVYITETSVDPSSLDFIFYNKKANKPTITKDALKACEADVKKETENQKEILKLAEENAKKSIRAMTDPIIKQLDPSYTLFVD